MRLVFLCIFFFLFFFKLYSNNINEIRTVYLNAYENIEFSYKLDSITKNFNKKNNPVEFSYNISAQFFISKHLKNPVKKLYIFNNCTKQLDQIINDNPESLEIRFLRYLVQLNAPRLLGYYNNIKMDYDFIVSNINNSDEDLKDFILPILRKIDSNLQ